MNLTVFTGPDPVKNIDELMRRTPFAGVSLLAVVPDFRSAASMERRLAGLSGGAVLGHRVLTFDGLAREILAYSPHPPMPISGHVKRALIAEIVRSRLGRDSVYKEVAGTRGFIRAVESYLDETRAETALENGNAEFTTVSKAYESHLMRLGVTDHEGAVRRVLSSPKLLESFAAACTGPLIVDGFYDLTSGQFAVLEQLMVRMRRSAVSLVSDSSKPELFSIPNELLERYQGLGARIIDVPGDAGGGVGTVLSGFMGGRYQGGGSRSDVAFEYFSSIDAEADWVAGTVRESLAGGECRPEDIMIVARNTPGHSSPLARALRRHGIPVERGVNIPFALAPLVRFLLEALEASVVPVEDKIQSVLRSGYSSACASGRSDLTGFQDDRVWCSMTAEDDSPEGFAASSKRIFDVLHVADNLDGPGDRTDAVFERVLYERFIGLLDEFAEFYMTFKRMMRSSEFMRLFRQFISDITIPSHGAAGQGVLVLGIEHARYVIRDTVIFTGLDNRSFPSGADRFNLHDEQAAARLKQHRESEEPLLFYMAMCGARKLVLTFPGVDNEGGADSLSPYAREIQEGIASWSQPERHKGIPGAAWVNGPVSERGRRESILRVLSRDNDLAGKLLSDLRDRHRELFNEIEPAIQTAISLTEEKGMTLTGSESLARLLGRYDEDHVYSVTEIEKYLDCPVNYFLARVLGLEPERIPEDGLDPGERGSLLHDILAHFYQTLKDTTGSTRFGRDALDTVYGVLDTVIDSAFLKRSEHFKRIRPLVLSAEKRMVRKWLRKIVEIEAAWFETSPFIPDKFETAFGDGITPPLELPAGDMTVRLKGRVDRIDIAEKDGIRVSRVVDYKSGKSPGRRAVEEGRDIQLPLYIAAAEDVIVADATVADACYYSLREASFNQAKKRIEKCTVIDGSEKELIQNAKELAVIAVNGIRGGLFAAPEKCSDRCEWRSLCRGDRARGEEGIHADS